MQSKVMQFVAFYYRIYYRKIRLALLRPVRIEFHLRPFWRRIRFTLEIQGSNQFGELKMYHFEKKNAQKFAFRAGNTSMKRI